MSKTRNPDALIRIEDAIKVLCREKCHPGALCPDNYCVEMWDEFEDVERVDAVPVVRCKDCRFWSKYPGSSDAPQYHECMARMTYIGNLYTTAGEYCSRGERKDGDRKCADD